MYGSIKMYDTIIRKRFSKNNILGTRADILHLSIPSWWYVINLSFIDFIKKTSLKKETRFFFFFF